MYHNEIIDAAMRHPELSYALLCGALATLAKMLADWV